MTNNTRTSISYCQLLEKTQAPHGNYPAPSTWLEFFVNVGFDDLIDGLARFCVAMVGGSFLLVPIIIMNCGHDQNWLLVTACVATILLSLFLAFMAQATNQDILAGSACYTAVLVVFVGTALSNASNVPGSTS